MFQYNLRTLLLVMLAFCLLTWLFFVLPGEIGVICLICIAAIAPSAVLAGILYFRGIPQAFYIGCVPPLAMYGIALLMDGQPWQMGPSNSTEIKIFIVVCGLVVIAAGAASAGVRWLAGRTQNRASAPAEPPTPKA